VKSRRIGWAGHVARIGRREVRGCGGEGKRPLGRQRCRWEDEINIAVQELGWGVVEVIWLMIGTGGGRL